MAKYRYTVTANGAPADGMTIAYKYRNTACTLTCSGGAASVAFDMGTKKDIDHPDFFEEALVKDALRKMYLFHAMGFDARLWIDRITVTCNELTVTYDAQTPNFPFLFSILNARELKLPEPWRDPDFLQAVLTPTKSKTENDARFACLFSFLAGIGKSYEIEKFTCYWTAMNAHYNYLYGCYRARCPQEGQTDQNGKKKKSARGGSDADCISALMRVLGCGEKLSTQAERSDKFKTEYGAMKSYLQPYSGEKLLQLHRELAAHRTEPGWTPDSDLGRHLHKCLHRSDRKPTASAWGFLLLDYAYYMRCKYFHGNKTTILFTSANDRELAALRVLNLFLGEYLKEAIPEMFKEGWFTEEMFDAVKCGIR